MVVGCVWQLIAIIRRSGSSSIAILARYFLTETIVLAGIRAYFFLADSGRIIVDEMTIMVVWHLLFYIAISIFLGAVYMLLGLVNVASRKLSLSTYWMLTIIAVILGVLSIWFPPRIMEGSWIETTGIMHVVAFVFAGAVAMYLLRIHIQFVSTIGNIANPLLIAIALLSLIHLWELVTESWQLVSLSGATIEYVEMLLWVPVYTSFFIAFRTFSRSVK